MKLHKPKEEMMKFNRIISVAFDQYMYIFIEHQRRVMQQAFDQIMSEETWHVPDEDRNKVLGSSTDLIYFFSKTRQQTSFLSKSTSYLQMYELFAKFLVLYADKLEQRLPSLDSLKDNKSLLSIDEEKVACCIINTAHYCSNTTTKTEESIKKEIDEKFREKINLETVVSKYQGVIALAVSVLVKSLEAKVAPAFDKMSKTEWEKWESVDDQSAYVDQISAVVQESVPFYNLWIMTNHFSFLCDAFAGSFVPTFCQAIYKCKKVSTVGAQQLLLDMASLKTVLLKLPTLGRSSFAEVPERYTKRVKREMLKVEKLLKVLLAPEENLVETYKQLITPHSDSDFVKILEIKGIKRSEMESYLDKYGSKVDSAVRAELKSSSSLSVLPDKASTIKRLNSLFTFTN